MRPKQFALAELIMYGLDSLRSWPYNDLSEGETDPELSRFSIEKDRKYVLPAIQLAIRKNPRLRFFASPWSPPAWMKDSDLFCSDRFAILLGPTSFRVRWYVPLEVAPEKPFLQYGQKNVAYATSGRKELQ
jgi:hypothetical protein